MLDHKGEDQIEFIQNTLTSLLVECFFDLLFICDQVIECLPSVLIKLYQLIHPRLDCFLICREVSAATTDTPVFLDGPEM